MMKTDDYILLRELVYHLPHSAKWTREYRDLWLSAMQSLVDLAMFERQQNQRKERVILPVYWNFVKGD